MSIASRPMSRRSTLDARENAPPPPHITTNLQHIASSPSSLHNVSAPASAHLATTTPTTTTGGGALPSRTPSLPLVVIKAQKPSSIQEIRDQALMTRGATTGTATGGGGARRGPSTSLDLHPHQEDMPPSIASSMAAFAMSTFPPSNNTTLPAAIQTRTIHPQVHYVFADDDPHTSSLLSQLPKARTISLHLDPATGLITDVDSFIPEFQITHVHAVPVPSPNNTAPPSTTGVQASTSSSSLSSGTGGAAGAGATNVTSLHTPTPLQTPPLTSSSLLSSSVSNAAATSSTILGQTKAARGQLPITCSNSSTSTTSGTSAMSRQSSLRDASSMTEPPAGGQQQPQPPQYRDWTLVIEGVETDPHPQQGPPGYDILSGGNDQTFMEDSAYMAAVSSPHGPLFGGGSGGNGDAPARTILTASATVGFHAEPDHETQQTNLVLNDDYLDDCDAILASFNARNKLLKKVLEFNDTRRVSSPPAGPATTTTNESSAKPGAQGSAEHNV